MDRIFNLLFFTGAYSSLCLFNIYLLSPPSHLTGKKKWDYMGQYISLVHAITAVILSLYIYIVESGVHYPLPTNSYHTLVISHSIGYFLYDMIFAEIVGIHDLAMRTHHCCILIGGTIMYMAETGGSAAVLCILLSEGSNPFMMLRKILRSKNMTETTGYKLVEVMFAASFIFFRTIPATFVNYNMWVMEIYLVTKLTVSLVYSVGFYWIYLILIIVVKEVDKNSAVNKVVKGILGLVSKNKALFGFGLFIWTALIPFYMTQIYRYGFINLKVGAFILL